MLILEPLIEPVVTQACDSKTDGSGAVATTDASDQTARRTAKELPYMLESAGEWTRLRKCLSSSLDVLHQLYNDKDKADLLRFWRQV